MKKWMLFAAMFVCLCSRAQLAPASNEAFINAVSKLVVDSSLAHYYLYQNAAPCSFKKFDYDEWYKYGLTEDVPIYILNELAKKSFLDSSPKSWQPDKLQNALCIDEEKMKAILAAPFKKHVKNTGTTFIESNIVFSFSRPEFTDDYQYAIIDMSFRCDNQQCGMGATFLFKQANSKWILAGKKLVWGN